MFYPIKIYSGQEIKEYAKESGDIVSSKVKENKKGKLISTNKIDKQYWEEFEKQEEQLIEVSMDVLGKDLPSVPYNDTYYE